MSEYDRLIRYQWEKVKKKITTEKTFHEKQSTATGNDKTKGEQIGELFRRIVGSYYLLLL